MIDFQNGSVFKLKKVEDAKFNAELAPLLVDGEKIVGCYQDVRDHVVFTDKRTLALLKSPACSKISILTSSLVSPNL